MDINQQRKKGCQRLHLPFATEEDRNSFYRTQQLF
jgi:hypothetical protein